MFDFAWSELALIAVVALIVIGPKDLPRVMRTAATWIRKARAIAHEFQGHLEQMVRDAELDEVRKEVEKATQLNLADEINKTIDPGGELRASLSEPLVDPPRIAAPQPPAQPAATSDREGESPAQQEGERAERASESPSAATHHSA